MNTDSMSNQKYKKADELRSSRETILAPYRVLDLTEGDCDFCGRILADLGADVIKVEPLCGSSGRYCFPHYQECRDPEKSLYWCFYNANKRSITLNLFSNQGKDIFNRLLNTAQVIIESFHPSHELKDYLSYTSISRLNPGIVATSITPFGLKGPYRNFKAYDLIGLAMGGAMYLTGDPDMPPTFINFPQAYLIASAHAAVATLIALWYREFSGRGQQVDVSVQACVCGSTQAAIPFWELNSQILCRSGSFRTGVSTNAKLRQIWKCKDGYVAFLIFGGKTGEKSNKAFIEWLDSEGMADDFLKSMDPAFDVATSSQQFHDQLSQRIEHFFLTHTKAELYNEALKRKIMLYPVSNMNDLLESPQLKMRDFWEQVDHSEIGMAENPVIFPGVFAKLSETPLRKPSRAPAIGEHNKEIYGELGLSDKELFSLKQEEII